MGANVAGLVVVIDLAFLPWREKLEKYNILGLVQYQSE
jgi:adenine/guanine phosphoribosyltransferase-like PRPP-binding protein